MFVENDFRNRNRRDGAKLPSDGSSGDGNSRKSLSTGFFYIEFGWKQVDRPTVLPLGKQQQSQSVNLEGSLSPNASFDRSGVVFNGRLPSHRLLDSHTIHLTLLEQTLRPYFVYSLIHS